MWYAFYNLALTLLLVVAIPLLPLVLLLAPRYRAGFGQRLGFYPRTVRERIAATHPLWIHAASVGEVRSVQPLVRDLKARAPERKILLSTFTATGHHVARQIPGVDAAIYLPLDFSWVVGRALRTFEPSVLLIIETEIWPNLLHAAYQRGVPTLLLSGRVSERAYARYRRLRRFFRAVLKCFTVLGMQSAADAHRIKALGADTARTFVVGNLKVAVRSGDGGRGLSALKDPKRLVVVAGSTHRGEEELVLRAFTEVRELFPEICLVLAPRHPQRFAEAEKLLNGGPFSFARKTDSPAHEYFSRDVLLLDTVGELTNFFAAGDIAFVGGSLVDVGGHNVLEPARHGKPVVFGPHMANFKALAEQLKHADAAIEVRDAEELARVLIDLIRDAQRRRELGDRAAAVAAAQADALTLNSELVRRYL